ncbi:glycerophosphodiester phosphodiesterase [Lapidilactobacillus achengensis]|uniref:Glycerophosphodiester phosphodiesterase n=1 Tax=Lapidilactobacillus achengensis TaxID=2486000 RepID=A0ABW1UK35_9LACO
MIFLLTLWVVLSAFVVVGHRGDPLNAPEETLASFDSAFKNGADYVELDLHVSQDNVLVVSHDRNLARITGHDAIVSQTPWAQIKTFKQANSEPMHSLDEIFAYYQKRPETKFLIETKKTKKGNPKNMEDLLVASIQRYGMGNRVMFHSFSLISLQNLKKSLPQVPRIFIAGTLKKINFEVLQTSTGINISSELVDAKLIRQLHGLGQKVYVWAQMTEHSSQWNWLVNLPIDGVVTNYPRTGNLYRNQKLDAKIKKADFTGALVTAKPRTSYENPYNLNLIKANATPLTSYHAQNYVISQGIPYYQIGSNRFIEAAGFNSATALPLTQLYLQQSFYLPATSHQRQLADNPFAPRPTGRYLQVDQRYQITAVQLNNTTLWFQVAGGWIRAQLGLTLFTPGSQAAALYQRLPAKDKLAIPYWPARFSWQAQPTPPGRGLQLTRNRLRLLLAQIK